MALLRFSDILLRAGIDLQRTLLIRHTTSNRIFKKCCQESKEDAAMIMTFTREQDCGFSNGFDYWAVFVSDHGTLCKFYGLFRVGSAVPNTREVMPVGYDRIDPDSFRGDRAFYDLERMDILKEYENRLIIDWGSSVRTWAQTATNEKSIIAIQNSEVFSGYEDVILSFQELEKIIGNPIAYNEWYTALSAVYGIYLIVDKKTGKQYIGSAYGKEGLWGRWSYYIKTKHGGNELMKKLLEEDPKRYKYFQFSILQILSKDEKYDHVVRIERRYKKKLFSEEFGLNGN